MTNKINNEEMKIKEQFLINIKSRNDEKKYKFTKWLNAQSNPQNSFLSLIEHCIDRFGYEDVTDHEIAKKLHTEILYYNSNEEIQLPEISTATNHINMKNSAELEPPKMKQKPASKEKVIEEKKVEVNEEKNNIDADLSSF
ncbi:hypothetical protein [Heyndrickxia sporothermodurans]|uniref:hypothetical protein n=1 Tax=Heyndrickxia sporothermodurans TaxID=46224 RepID=UPI000D34264B|nr:hypothetical protein [Heyndrickxia sporothermodurans]PTY92338.1 hypothetical protein B5V90_03520 [Heyndrickxia sporothermodurans]